MTALRLVLSGDSAGAVAAINEVGGATTVLGEKTQSAEDKQKALAKSGAAGMKLIAGGAALAVGAIAACVDVTEKQMKAVYQLQQETGLNAKAASEMTAQWQALGVPVDVTGKLVGRTLKVIGGFADGATKSTSAVGKAFTALGLTSQQVAKMGAGPALDLIRDKISKMHAGLERTTIIMSIFGRQATSNVGLLRWLEASNSQLSQINAKAKQFGLIFTQQQINSGEQFAKMLLVVEMALKGMAVQASTAVMPSLLLLARGLVGGLLLFEKIAAMFGPLKGVFMLFVVMLPGVLVMAVGLFKVVTAFKGLTEAGLSAGQAFGKMSKLIANVVRWMNAENIAQLRNNIIGRAQILITNLQAAATGLWASAQWAVAAALDACGLGELLLIIGLIILAIIAVVVALTHWKTTMHLLRAAWHLFTAGFMYDLKIMEALAKLAFGFILKHWKLMIELILAPWLVAVQFIIHHLGDITAALTSWFSWIEAKFRWLEGVIEWPWLQLEKIIQRVVGEAKSALSVLNPLHDISSLMGGGGGGSSIQPSQQNTPITWHGLGGEFDVHKPTLIGVGEKGTEHISIVPEGGASGSLAASRGAHGGGRAGLTVQVVVQNVFGTINRQIAQQWAEPLAQTLGEKLYDTMHGARH